ncbi:hypothetical protein LTR70_004348 [Exophiala xenobiotica]|uniref:DUF1765-domain-containing protein n=1 Tax=Lithohypha guttulata TaxID=1690604 RepID=A0ABR0KL96_9EURO|nr:hypothetical protein LTR24_001925 [Lithohypha guttulata]KAK5320939.1 hypothetical protein LTR70_004348 [Exophiala xenobiotica]
MSRGSVEADPLPSIPIHTLQTKDSYRVSHSASYTSLPGMVESTQGIKRTFSDNVLNSLAQKPAKVSSSVQNANIELFRRASSKTKKRMSVARFVSVNEIEESERERARRPLDKPGAASTKAQGRGAGALKMFSRKTWLPTSRQSSPSRNEESGAADRRSSSSNVQAKTDMNSIAMPQPVATRVSPRSSQNSDETPPSLTRDSGVSRKYSSSPAPPSHTTSENSMELESEASSKRLSRRSSFSSLRSRASIDRMYLSVPSTKLPPLPSVSPDRVSDRSSENGRQRDPHWIPFRSIDGEYASFQSKTSLQKAKVVRTILLPLLSKTLDRAAVHSLRAEDLDRRIVILNKWWTGLMELLHGSGQQSISGTDRPAFLEAICEIMVRPEWKTPPYNSSPTEPSDLQQCTMKTDSQSSIDSDEPDFLVRTIHQNIRNMFVQNIIQQMTFVVDKLSMRAAPASLVIFGGKTCAYGFFFCPGVADMLARLWHIPPGTLRRIFAEYGPASGRKAGIISRALASSFPPALRSLCFSSYTALSRQLQNKAQTPPNTAHIRWHGPWINRWIGRDSDLFFVFVKHYHLLVAEHLPRHLLLEERMGVPGLVVVHAQVLMNLESALYRQAGNVAAEHYSPASGDNPDAMAPLPMVIPNATRSIGENRLVMLLRDVIGKRRPGNAALAEVLVGSFQYILKAAVRKVSMYNNDACFVLCDFLEELVPLVTKYQQVHVEDEDWGFWLKVYRQLMQSQATMTQIRVIAFLYSTWSLLIINEEKKKQLVLDWLLEPRFFAQYFNHWSPMVRHYFYRLLCWRIARSDGNASDVDMEIYQRLSQLLNRSWAHHQYLAADAEMRDTAPPSTNPCSPAPGRALLIIRTDAHNRGASFTSFDKLMPPGANQSSPYTSHSSMLSKVPEADAQQTTTKKRWSILKTIGLFSGPTNSRPGEVTPPGSPDPANEGGNSRHSGSNKEQQAISRPSSPPPQPLNFRFSLEYSNSRPQLPSKGRKLPLPSLPHTSQKLLDDLNKLEGMSSQETLTIKEIKPLKPRPEELNTARYSGRALSEWAQVVHECRNFYVRRKQEGCRSDSAVETPCIAVESFRMFA